MKIHLPKQYDCADHLLCDLPHGGTKEIELSVTKEEWGLLAEGDEGELTYQGNWYQEFEKTEKESLSRRLLDEIES